MHRSGLKVLVDFGYARHRCGNCGSESVSLCIRNSPLGRGPAGLSDGQLDWRTEGPNSYSRRRSSVALCQDPTESSSPAPRSVGTWSGIGRRCRNDVAEKVPWGAVPAGKPAAAPNGPAYRVTSRHQTSRLTNQRYTRHHGSALCNARPCSIPCRLLSSGRQGSHRSQSTPRRRRQPTWW